jgi:PAS domain S-box-containing protein
MALNECPMARALCEGRAVNGEVILVERPDGSRRRVLTHPAPIRNSSGAVVGAVNTLVDLTESNMAGEAQPQPPLPPCDPSPSSESAAE